MRTPAEQRKIVQRIKAAAEEEGYKIIDMVVRDYGETVKLIIENEGILFYLPVFEHYYDTDSKGQLTTYHGYYDVTETQWYKELT